MFLSGIKVCFEQEQGIEKTKSRCRDWMERRRKVKEAVTSGAMTVFKERLMSL